MIVIGLTLKIVCLAEIAKSINTDVIYYSTHYDLSKKKRLLTFSTACISGTDVETRATHATIMVSVAEQVPSKTDVHNNFPSKRLDNWTLLPRMIADAFALENGL